MINWIIIILIDNFRSDASGRIYIYYTKAEPLLAPFSLSFSSSLLFTLSLFQSSYLYLWFPLSLPSTLFCHFLSLSNPSSLSFTFRSLFYPLSLSNSSPSILSLFQFSSLSFNPPLSLSPTSLFHQFSLPPSLLSFPHRSLFHPLSYLLNLRYPFDTEQTFPISVDTMAFFGIALSSSLSACLGRIFPSLARSIFSVMSSNFFSHVSLTCASFDSLSWTFVRAVTSDIERKRDRRSLAASLQSPLMPTSTDFTRPILLGSVST